MSSQTTQQAQAAQEALATGTWRGDTVHSTAGFAVTYMAGTFQGTFSAFDARLSDSVLRDGPGRQRSGQGPQPGNPPPEP